MPCHRHHPREEVHIIMSWLCLRCPECPTGQSFRNEEKVPATTTWMTTTMSMMTTRVLHSAQQPTLLCLQSNNSSITTIMHSHRRNSRIRLIIRCKCILLLIPWLLLIACLHPILCIIRRIHILWRINIQINIRTHLTCTIQHHHRYMQQGPMRMVCNHKHRPCHHRTTMVAG